jgi:hypothetical protein
MNPRNTAILAALAAGLFAFIFFYERHLHAPIPPPPRVLPDLNPAAVTAIEVQPADGLKIRAERTNGGWQLTKPLVYPAQAPSVDALLSVLSTLSYEIHITPEELQLSAQPASDFGFDAPMYTILIEEGTELRQLKIGKRTAPGDQVYVRVEGIADVNVVGTDVLNYIPARPEMWRDTTFVDLNGSPFDRLTVTSGGRAFEFQKDATNQLWRMTAPIPARADNLKIADLLSRLGNLHVTGFVPDSPKPDLDQLGLQPPQCEIAAGMGTNQVLSIEFGGSPPGHADLAYARVNQSRNVVVVARDQVDAWRGGYEQFRDPRLAGTLPGPPELIEERDGENFTAALTNGTWVVLDETRKVALPADTNLMRDFVERLAGLQIAASPGKFAANDAVIPANLGDYGLATPARKYLLFRGVATSDGGRTNQLMAEMDFGSQAGDRVYARRGDLPDESSVYLVKLDDYRRLATNGIALRERRIWGFTEDKVLSLEVRDNGVTRKLDHHGPNSWVLAADSQGIVDSYDQFETEAAAGELGGLSAAGWVACGDAARAQYGFSDKGTRITLAMKGDAPETLTLDLGGWSPRKLRYGAVQLDGLTWIFEVPPDVLERVTAYLKIHDTNAP